MDCNRPMDLSKQPEVACDIKEETRSPDPIKEEPRSPDPTPPIREPPQPYHAPHHGYCGYQGHQPNVPVPPDTALIGYYPPLLRLYLAPQHQLDINQRPNYEHYVNAARPEYDRSIYRNGYSTSSATSASPASITSDVTNPLNLWRPFIDPHSVPGPSRLSRPDRYYNERVLDPSRPTGYYNEPVPGPSRSSHPSQYYIESVPGPSRSSRPSQYYNESVPGPSFPLRPSGYYNYIYDEAPRSFHLVPPVAPDPSHYVRRTIASGQPPVLSIPCSSRLQPPAIRDLERSWLADLFHVDDTIYNNHEYESYESKALQQIAEKNGGTLTPCRPQMRRNFIRRKGETDDSYRERRDKNNQAAKLSRDRRKKREIQLAIRVSYLRLRRQKVKRLIAQLQ